MTIGDLVIILKTNFYTLKGIFNQNVVLFTFERD